MMESLEPGAQIQLVIEWDVIHGHNEATTRVVIDVAAENEREDLRLARAAIIGRLDQHQRESFSPCRRSNSRIRLAFPKLTEDDSKSWPHWQGMLVRGW